MPKQLHNILLCWNQIMTKITDTFFIWSNRILWVERIVRYFYPWPTVHDCFFSTFAVQEYFLVIAQPQPPRPAPQK